MVFDSTVSDFKYAIISDYFSKSNIVIVVYYVSYCILWFV